MKRLTYIERSPPTRRAWFRILYQVGRFGLDNMVFDRYTKVGIDEPAPKPSFHGHHIWWSRQTAWMTCSQVPGHGSRSRLWSGQPFRRWYPWSRVHCMLATRHIILPPGGNSITHLDGPNILFEIKLCSRLAAATATTECSLIPIGILASIVR